MGYNDHRHLVNENWILDKVKALTSILSEVEWTVSRIIVPYPEFTDTFLIISRSPLAPLVLKFDKAFDEIYMFLIWLSTNKYDTGVAFVPIVEVILLFIISLLDVRWLVLIDGPDQAVVNPVVHSSSVKIRCANDVNDVTTDEVESL